MSLAAPSRPPEVEPVIAEIVPPAPSPWRFGLRALIVLMVICSLQFALMSYLTVLGGLIVGGLLCFAAFTAIVLFGMIPTRQSTRWLPHLDQLVVRLMLAMVLIFVGSIIAGGGTAAYHAYARIKTEALLEQDLGLSLKPTMVNSQSSVTWGLHITNVKDGGVAHQAGLQKDEVIIVSGTVDEFFQRLNESRGKDMDINVASGVLGGQSIENCPQRSVTLPVPK